MAKPRKFSGEEDDSTRPMETHSARYWLDDLQKLKVLLKASGIWPGQWLRNALHALIEAYDRKGVVSVPFVVVGRDEAEKAGLVPPLPATEPSEEIPQKLNG